MRYIVEQANDRVEAEDRLVRVFVARRLTRLISVPTAKTSPGLPFAIVGR
jgi:hypothetical protein